MKHWWVAALLAIVPGLGHVYLGNVFARRVMRAEESNLHLRVLQEQSKKTFSDQPARSGNSNANHLVPLLCKFAKE